MRRSLVLAGALFAGLLAAVPALAMGDTREIERDVAFGLDVEGFTIRVFVDNNDGDVMWASHPLAGDTRGDAVSE